MEGGDKLFLGYWNIRGVGERVRLLLEYTGLPYEDHRYAIGAQPNLWFTQDKPRLLEKNPAANVPYLRDGGRVVAESDAVCVYICHRAQRTELLGRTPEEQVAMATVMGVFKDFHKATVAVFFSKDYEHDLASYKAKTAPGYLNKLKGLLGHKDYIAGGITWVDFAVGEFLQAMTLLMPDVIYGYPTLVAYFQRIWALPELQSYFASDRWDEHSVIPPFGAWKPTTHVTLGYWKIRGLGERLRHLLEYLKVPYHQVLYDDAAEHRDAWFKGAKEALKAKNPLVNLPYLQDGHSIVSETNAIAVHLCHKAGRADLLGRTPQQQVEVAAVLGALKDLNMQSTYVSYGFNGKPLADNLAEFKPKFQDGLQKLSAFLGKKEFMAGELTWADFAVADFLQAFNLMVPEIVGEHPSLLEYQGRVWGLPELKEYFESGRWQERPVNSSFAAWK